MMTHPPENLSISEELLLLSMDDEKGKLVTCSMDGLAFTLAGAVLFELMLLGKIEIEEDRVKVWPTKPQGDPVFDMAIARFAKNKKVRALKYWVSQLSKDSKKIKKILLDKLVEEGALKKEERQFLWTIRYNRYPTDDSRIEDRIRMRVFDSLFEKQKMDTRDYILLTLIGAAKLEKEVFPEEKVKEAKRRIAYIRGDDAIGSAISSAIKEFEAAMTAAIVATLIVPAITSA